MGFAGYRDVLRDRSLRRLLAVAAVARIPYSAAGLLLTLHVVQTLGRSYAAAGLVAAAATVGTAIGAPWRGRLVDRVGLRRAVVPSIVAEIVLWPLAAVSPYVALVPVVLLGGLLELPIFTVVRKAISLQVPAAQHRSAYALDAICAELVWMVGPAAAVALGTAFGTAPVLVAIGVAQAVAGLCLLALNPPTRADQVIAASASASAAPEVASPGTLTPGTLTPGALQPGALQPVDPALGAPPARRLGWLTARVAFVLAAAGAATFVLTGTDLSILASLRAHDLVDHLWVVYLAWCGGSVVGGLAYGARHRSTSSLWLLLALGACTVPMAFAAALPGVVGWLSALAFVAGLPCAPVMTATAEEIARLVPEERRGEAMGVQTTALTVGGAIGAPLLGAVLDHGTPGAAFAVSGLVGAVIAVAGLLVRTRRGTHPAGLSTLRL